MTELGYTLAAYVLGLGALLGYALAILMKLRGAGLAAEPRERQGPGTTR